MCGTSIVSRGTGCIGHSIDLCYRQRWNRARVVSAPSWVAAMWSIQWGMLLVVGIMPVGPGPCLVPVLVVWGGKCGAFSRGWKFAHRRRRGYVTSLKCYFMSGCVPDYWCNVSDRNLSRYVYCYSGVRGVRFAASGASLFSTSQIQIHQGRAFRIRGLRVRICFEKGWAPSEAMFGGTTITAAACVLYASLASCVFGEERCP